MKTLVSTTMRGGMNFDSACDGRLQTEKFAGQRLEPRATSDARQTDFLIIYPSLYNGWERESVTRPTMVGQCRVKEIPWGGAFAFHWLRIGLRVADSRSRHPAHREARRRADLADSDSPWPMGGQWVAALMKVETDPFYFVRLRGLTPEMRASQGDAKPKLAKTGRCATVHP